MKKTKLIVIAALVLSLLGSTCVVAEAAENRTRTLVFKNEGDE